MSEEARVLFCLVLPTLAGTILLHFFGKWFNALPPKRMLCVTVMIWLLIFLVIAETFINKNGSILARALLWWFDFWRFKLSTL